MDQVLQDMYAAAMSANNLHTRNRNRWQFLLDSFVGGQEYRNGGYLTRYVLETEAEYAQRLLATPLENHCRSIVDTYISFLFREQPEREWNSLENEPALESFLEDCDWEGRDIDSFMKQASVWANVFGHCWIIMSKPDIGAITRADELVEGVRPYLNLLTPLSVLDWKWSRRVNGSYELTYLKYVEDANDSITVIKEWKREEIVTTTVNHKEQTVIGEVVEPNGLGRIPAVILYAQTSPVRGIGLSSISDLADQQRYIYNMTSEAEQAIRLGSHPSLVKTEATQAGSGAGSIIHMPEHLDPNLKPYVLEFTGSDVSSIYTAIKHASSTIDTMANTGSIRATEAREMSGVAMTVEFELLNARLSEMADNIELAEEQLWELYCEYQGYEWDGEIEYPSSFSIRDTGNELKQILDSLNGIQDPVKRGILESAALKLLDIEHSEEDYPEEAMTPHMMLNPQSGQTVVAANMQEHEAAIRAGYTQEGPAV